MAGDFAQLSAAEVVRRLALAPHPEGGFYRETFRDAAQTPDGRAVSTAIYFLLPCGAVSAWHKVDAAEVWHFYAGTPLRLTLRDGAGRDRTHILGPDLTAGQEPQCVVPAGVWQMAEAPATVETAALPPWSLVGCTVAPGFTFAGFELAGENGPPG